MKPTAPTASPTLQSTPLTPIKIAQLASLKLDIPDSRLQTKLHACPPKCVLIKRAFWTHKTHPRLYKHDNLLHTLFTLANVNCVLHFFSRTAGVRSLKERLRIAKTLQRWRGKKSAVFWQVHCTRQFSVQNTKRHLSLQLGRKERGGCEWMRERKERGEKDTRENWLLCHCGSARISLLTPFLLTQHAF